MELLGWKLKPDSINYPKRKFTGLGVVFNFHEDARKITIENKESRMAKIEKEIFEVRPFLFDDPLHKTRLKYFFGKGRQYSVVG